MKKSLVFLLTILLFTGCQWEPEKPTPVATAVVTPAFAPTPRSTFTPLPPLVHVTVTSRPQPPRLRLSDYPPGNTPYHIDVYDFWLVHTLDGQLLAFSPISPKYALHIGMAECRYAWAATNQRFEDPCSGDKWTLEGGLDIEASAALWSNRNLDQYDFMVLDDRIFVQTGQPIQGTGANDAIIAQAKQYGVHITAVSATHTPDEITIKLLTYIDPVWQIEPYTNPWGKVIVEPAASNALVDDHGDSSQWTAMSNYGHVRDTQAGIRQQTEIVWEALSPQASNVTASLVARFQNLHFTTTLPINWLEHQAGEIWPLNIPLEIGRATAHIDQIEWLNTLANNQALVRLTLTDTSRQGIRLDCLFVDTIIPDPPIDPLQCTKFENKMTFDLITTPNQAIPLYLWADVTLLRPFRLHFPASTFTTQSRCWMDGQASPPFAQTWLRLLSCPPPAP